MSKHQIKTEIEIDAGPARIQGILADFATCPEWNPFIRRIRGMPKRGERLDLNIQPGNAKDMTLRPSVLVAEAGREFRWLGRLLCSGIFDGDHRLDYRPLAGLYGWRQPLRTMAPLSVNYLVFLLLVRSFLLKEFSVRYCSCRRQARGR